MPLQQTVSSENSMSRIPSDRPRVAEYAPITSADEPMIEAVGLSKYYGHFAACRDVTFAINKGEVVAFLGPNGAGKSTTMKLLTGYLAPSAGSARIAGYDMSTERLLGAERLGYLPENGPLYPDMSPRSLLTFFGHARGLSGMDLRRRIESVVNICHLEAVIGKPIGKLSKGYRQRVGVAQALLHDPEVLILDEPTAGLDPNQIREVRKLIRELGEKKTILLSTHILQEVEAMCNRVLFINEGRLVFDGTPQELAAEQGDLDERFHELSIGAHIT
jgi:ABC-2 type transport system ATP-binding protein